MMIVMTMIRTYSELLSYKSFEERYEYLRLNGSVGATTFGFDRYLNQLFYNSVEWKNVRNDVIERDDGLDMGCKDSPIGGIIIVHHMNPIMLEDLETFNPDIMNPEYLISVALRTHNAIHFGDKILNPYQITERKRGDTTLW